MELLVRLSGEISIKARRTRLRFSERLAQNMRNALEGLGVPFEIDRQWSRIYVRCESGAAVDRLSHVFGIQSLSIVERAPAESLEAIVAGGESRFRDAVQGKRFAVRARRGGDKERIPFSSREIERALGAALLPHARCVDLDDPEITVHVEVRDGEARFFTDRVTGPGGLPLGTEGRALALISGGFDSAVAAWLMLKRGVALDYLLCNLGGAAQLRGVVTVLKELSDRWSYGDRPRLTVLDFRPVVEALQQKTNPRYWQVLLKRQMLQAAERVLRGSHASALVTGEALGQVSSQTLANLETISQATRVPILRPLLGFDKEEIIERARRIGTYESSAIVKEYCALVPSRPATRATLKAVLSEEAELDEGLLDPILESRQAYDLKELPDAAFTSTDLEIEEIPPSARVIDLRPESAYRAWHYPGAERRELFEALAHLEAFEPGVEHVIYCELGLKSAHLAERMRAEGLNAWNFKGGLARLLRYAAERDLVSAEGLPSELLLG